MNFKFVLSVCSEEPMIPDEHDEVDLNDFDPKVCIYFKVFIVRVPSYHVRSISLA